MEYKPLTILMGGSPCTHWSIAQSKNREVKAEGLGWELFKNFVIAKERYKPECARLPIKGNESLKRVYHPDFKSPTLTTCGGGNTQKKYI